MGADVTQEADVELIGVRTEGVQEGGEGQLLDVWQLARAVRPQQRHLSASGETTLIIYFGLWKLARASASAAASPVQMWAFSWLWQICCA